MVSVLDRKFSQRGVVTFCLLLLAVVAGGDAWTGESLSFSLFYLLPVAVAAWYAGRNRGLLFSLLAALIWGVIDAYISRVRVGWPVEIWNTLIHLGLFSITSLSLAEIAKLLALEKLLSRTDALTGLANRRHFLEKLEAEIARSRRFSHVFCLAYLDLDDFKAINDRLGHEAGDRLLQQIGEAMISTLRVTDTPARMGGDEFAVLLPETTGDAALVAFEHLQPRLREISALYDWKIGWSVGLICFKIAPKGSNEALGLADELMYSVKRSGKHRVLLHTYPQHEQPAPEGDSQPAAPAYEPS